MSPIKLKRKDLPALLAVLLICGCAPDAAGPQGQNAPRVGQAGATKKTCPICGVSTVGATCEQPVPAGAVPTPVYFTPTPVGAPIPISPAGTFTPVQPTAYIPAAPVADVVVSNTKTQKRPVGTWEREVGSCRIVLRFEEDRLFGTCSFKDKKDAFTLCMDADYQITKDNVLYGVITGSEATGRDDSEEAVVYVDMPFSARVRQDGDLLTVKGVKFLERGIKSDDPRELIVIEGRYKRQPKLSSSLGGWQ